jgi:excisionase family DNA binding protein
MSETKPTQYLTINQVAERLQVDRRTVQKAIRIGRLEAALIFRQWRISEDALTDYVQSCTPALQVRESHRKRNLA